MTDIKVILIGISGGIEYLRLKAASRNPQRSQARTLRSILEYARNTVYGKKHRFDHILEARSDEELVSRYRECVGSGTYEDVRGYVGRMKTGEPDVLFPGKPVMYATTSGATGEPKWIPISKAYLTRIYGKLNRAWIFNLAMKRPQTAFGKILTIVGKQVEGHAEDGTVYGSVSAFTQARCPGFIRGMFACPSSVYDIEDYTARNYAIMRFGLVSKVTALVTPNPSSLVEMQHDLDRWWDELLGDIEAGTLTRKVDIPDSIRRKMLSRLKPDPRRAAELRALKERFGRVLPKHFWPDLHILCTWKCGNTRIYLDRFEGCFPEDVYYQELSYFSSECRAGVVVDDSVETALAPHMHFFEFKKEGEYPDPAAPFYQLHELEPGRRYCVFVTTYSGLYRYDMHDVVEAAAPAFGRTPRIHMVRKVNGVVSITGEKLYEGQFVNAVNQASAETGLRLAYFAGYANLEHSRYDWYFEFEDRAVSQADADDFGRHVDAILKTLNIEYASKRNSSRLRDQKVFRLEKDSFRLWKEAVVNASGQDASRFKPNVLAQNPALHEEIGRHVVPQENSPVPSSTRARPPMSILR